MADPAEELQAAILGGPEWYTRNEMAEATRLDQEQVAALWRAMGFPDVGDARAFTDEDLSALVRVSALIERGLVDVDGVVELARSIGQNTARLAEWQYDFLGRHVLGDLERTDMTPETFATVKDEVAEVLPELERLMDYVWRRQVAAIVAREWVGFGDEADEQDGPDIATVGFADLVSFTRLSRQLDEAELGGLVETFESRSADLIHAESGRLVKTLGDEVMFLSETPHQAANIAIALHETLAALENVPEIRVGLSTGPVLTRMGDVYGTTVNRASRYTAIARPDSTVIDTATSEALQSGPQADRFLVKALTPRPVRGFGIVRPYSLAARAE